MTPMSDTEAEALAATFSQCIELMLTPEQAEQLPDGEPGHLLIGSIQRRNWPHPLAGEFKANAPQKNGASDTYRMSPLPFGG